MGQWLNVENEQKEMREQDAAPSKLLNACIGAWCVGTVRRIFPDAIVPVALKSLL